MLCQLFIIIIYKLRLKCISLAGHDVKYSELFVNFIIETKYSTSAALISHNPPKSSDCAESGEKSMKKIDRMKTLQLIIFLLITIFSMYIVVFRDGGSRNAVLMLWVTLAVSFFFIFLDFIFFADQQKSYEKMMNAIGSDPVSKIANRHSIDALLDKYEGRTLPADFACIAFEVVNIRDINRELSRSAGNEALKRFAVILNLASVDNFFAARNGGNRFAAMSDNLSREDIYYFLQRISDKVAEYNSHPYNPKIKYTIGAAFNDSSRSFDIVDLIALANRRIDRSSEVHNIAAVGSGSSASLAQRAGAKSDVPGQDGFIRGAMPDGTFAGGASADPEQVESSPAFRSRTGESHEE